MLIAKSKPALFFQVMALYRSLQLLHLIPTWVGDGLRVSWRSENMLCECVIISFAFWILKYSPDTWNNELGCWTGATHSTKYLRFYRWFFSIPDVGVNLFCARFLSNNKNKKQRGVAITRPTPHPSDSVPSRHVVTFFWQCKHLKCLNWKN